MEKLPHFVIIGAGKSASTWLHIALRQHPSIFMPEHETPFFEDPQYNSSDLSCLYAELHSAPAASTIGIKRPNYLCTPECADRLARHLPDALLVTILRNPVDRAVSQYYHLVRSGRLPYTPPDAAFAGYLRGIFNAPFIERIVLQSGLYAQGIENYRRVFPRNQMLILTDLDMHRDPSEVFKRTCRFLNVSDSFLPTGISRPRNQGVYLLPMLSIIQSLNARGHTFDARTGWGTARRDIVGIASRRIAKLGSRISAAARTFVYSQRPRISMNTRVELLNYYLPEITNLEAITGLDLSAWKSLTHPQMQSPKSSNLAHR